MAGERSETGEDEGALKAGKQPRQRLLNVGVCATKSVILANHIRLSHRLVNFLHLSKKNGIRSKVWIFDGCAIIEYGLEAD